MCCPLHSRGGCGFARHGTYERKTPAGTKIPRWYCPEGHCTFSLLPDHLAARFPGTLAQIERVVEAAESASSLEAAAAQIRPDPISLPSALRWIRRRVAPVRASLIVIIAMFPELCRGCAPRIAVLRERLGRPGLLSGLRERAARHLHALSTPLGFRHRAPRFAQPGGRIQQPMGPDPPAGLG